MGNGVLMSQKSLGHDSICRATHSQAVHDDVQSLGVTCIWIDV